MRGARRWTLDLIQGLNDPPTVALEAASRFCPLAVSLLQSWGVATGRGIVSFGVNEASCYHESQFI
jgi:hypothetical protein